MARKKNGNRLPLIVCILAMSFFGAGALGIVWLRMEISTVAKQCGKLEDEREIVSREVQELRGQKSRSLRPSTLASMVSGRLSMLPDSRTIYVSAPDMSARLGDGRGVRRGKSYGSQGEFAGTR